MRTKKKSYKVSNWHEYNRALINRGNLNLWFNQEVRDNWYAEKASKQKQGRPFTYSSICIETALSLRYLFNFPLRSTQGFLEGLKNSLGIEGIGIPHYSCFSRRSKDVKINLSKKAKKQGATDVVVDSTGLKIYGEGEWKMRTHGKGKRRTWRKFHVAVNPKTGEILSMELTKGNRADCKMMRPLLKGLKCIRRVYADGARTQQQNASMP